MSNDVGMSNNTEMASKNEISVLLQNQKVLLS